MARFDVYSGRTGYLLDCQTDFLGHLTTRFVIPLMPADEVPQPIAKLHPVIEFRDKPYIIATHLASAVAATELGSRAGSLREHEFTISNALDMLINGF